MIRRDRVSESLSGRCAGRAHGRSNVFVQRVVRVGLCDVACLHTSLESVLEV